MKNILLIVAALGILGAIVAGCSQPAADPATTGTTGTTGDTTTTGGESTTTDGDH